MAVFLAVWACQCAGAAVHEAGAQVREIAISADGTAAYLAVQDRNEVWRANPATGEVSSRIPAGAGPCALALSSDGTTLAVANRFGNALTLVDTATMTVTHTAQVGESPSAVASLPNGFGVICPFDDSLFIIPRDPSEAMSQFSVPGVPVAVAAQGTSLAVAASTPPRVVVLDPATGAVLKEVALPSPPSCITYVGSRLAVGTEAGLFMVAADAARAMPAGLDAPVLAVASEGERVLAATDAGIFAVDADGIEAAGPYGGVRALAVSNGVAVFASPAQGQWGLVEVETAAPVPVAGPATVPEPAPEAPAAPPASPSPEPGPETQEAPAAPEAPAVPPVVEAAPAAQVETPAEQESAPAVAQAAPAAELAAAVEDPEPRGSVVPGPPAAAMDVAAPKPYPRRPSSSIIGVGPRERGISEAVQDAFMVGEGETAFQAPDWTKPFDSIEAEGPEGTIIYSPGGDIEGKYVQFQLGATHFRADWMRYSKTDGEIEARGDVVITQGPATATADAIKYVLPMDAEIQPPPLVSHGLDLEQEAAKQLFASGYLVAENIHIREPIRELQAQHFEYDFTSQIGAGQMVEGRAGTVYFGAEDLELSGPRAMLAEEFWITTCDPEHRYYTIRFREGVVKPDGTISARAARLQLGKTDTPLYWPKWTLKAGDAPTVGFDFDSGRRAEIGYYLNVGQRFALRDEAELGIRLYPTEKQGIGLGLEGEYDFTGTPYHPMYLGEGTFRTLYTTKERGFHHVYHRHEPWKDTVVLLQWEQWYDRDSFKDFYYEEYKDRTQPRTFANVTHTAPGYIASGTVRANTHDFVPETERLPEASFHLLERPLLDRIYLSFDSVQGYNEREPAGTHALRSINVARASLDLDLHEALSITPYIEGEASWYSDTFDGDDSDVRLSTTVGTTLQSRFHRTYPGAFGFSSFKHVVVPSVTYSYRPEPTMDVEETPRFDALDNVYGRSRLESKVDNLIYGRDEVLDESWQVARLTIYQGNDFWNELRKSEDYEIEIDVRPRPWWGAQLIGEHHSILGDADLDEPFAFERTILEVYEDLFDEAPPGELSRTYNARYGDYNRILSFLYYDDTVFDGDFRGRLGFAYTETQDRVFNREVLYGLGYRFTDRWSLSFEHRYDLERDSLYRQKYELRRSFQCLEGALQFQERESGWDVGLEIGIAAFPGTKVRF